MTDFVAGQLYEGGAAEASEKRLFLSTDGTTAHWMAPINLKESEAPLTDFQAWYDAGGREGPVPRVGE